MLVQLRIQNLAVIEGASIGFGPGLNVVTGETGAGKSIVAQALHIVLGERAKSDWVRRGASFAEVEALFRFPSDFPITARLLALEWLPVDREEGPVEVLIRRTVSTAGRSRVFVNGHLTTVGLLSELMKGVVDRTDQHAHTLLTTEEHQLALLDRFAGSQTDAAQYQVSYARLRELGRTYHALETATQERLQQEDFLRFQLKEFDAIDPQEGEDTLLRIERDKLANASTLSEAALHAERVLVQGSGAVVSVLGECARELGRTASLDPALEALLKRLLEARIELEDVAYEARRYSDALDSDPLSLDRAESRLFALEKLRRRFGPEWGQVLGHFKNVRQELDRVEGADGELDALSKRREEAAAEVKALAKRLATTRRAAARVLEDEVAGDLNDLGMEGARIAFDFTPMETPGPTGGDRVALQIATNTGDKLRPLEKVASGGERSRLLLALKRVLADADEVPIAIFDEIDSGVGGRVSESVGRKLVQLGVSGQVIAITHLAPIAAMGRRHLVVQKHTAEGRAHTNIELVEGEVRLREVARMLGGSRESQGAADHARELLQLSSGPKTSIRSCSQHS